MSACFSATDSLSDVPKLSPTDTKKGLVLLPILFRGVSVFLPMEGSNAITRNQSRTCLRTYASKIRRGCQTGLLDKPFALVLVRLLGGNA